MICLSTKRLLSLSGTAEEGRKQEASDTST